MVEKSLKVSPENFPEQEIFATLIRLTLSKARQIKLSDNFLVVMDESKKWEVENKDFIEIKYDAKSTNPDKRHAQIFFMGRVVGKMIIHHLPLYAITENNSRSQSGSQLLLRKLRYYLFPNSSKEKPLPVFRETIQFINSVGKSWMLEEADASIEQQFLEKNTGYDIRTDVIHNPSPFPKNFTELLEKFHEYGHAFRYGLMNREQKAAVLSEFHLKSIGINSNDMIKREKAFRSLKEEIYEELVADSHAIERIVSLFIFFGIDEKEIQRVINLYCINLLTYIPDSVAFLDELEVITDWTQLGMHQ